MLLFHGSARYDDIMKSGLLANSGVENDFGPDNSLVSCGGVYLTDDLAIAAFYAEMSSNSEMSLGMDPCIFAVDVDHQFLIADEDKIWSVLKRIVERYLDESLDGGLSTEEVEEMLEDNVFGQIDFYTRVAGAFELDANDKSTEEAIKAGTRAFAIRSGSYEWDPREEHVQEIEDINRLCTLASVAITREWFFKHQMAMTCRTLQDISPMGTQSPCKIVGAMRLGLSVDGLSVTETECFGELDEQDIAEFQEKFVERMGNRGITITPYQPALSMAG